MAQIIVGILIGAVMIGACIFVSDTRKKHGVCCGKGCNGCPVDKEVREQLRQRELSHQNEQAP